MDSIFTLKDLIAEVLQGRWQGSITTDADADVRLEDELRLTADYCGAVRHQEKVIVLVSNTIETVAALLNVWHRGGVVIPVKRDVPESAVRDIIDDCGAHYLLDPAAHTLSRAIGSRPPTPSASPFRYRTEPRLTGVDLTAVESIYIKRDRLAERASIACTHSNAWCIGCCGINPDVISASGAATRFC